MSMTDLPPARILDVTEAEYFADPSATPSLSHSIAHILLSRSPYHAWAAHPKLGGYAPPAEASDTDEEPDEKAFDEGKIIHSLMLGKGVEVEVCHFDDFRKKEAREQRDAARAAGRVPVIAAKYESMVKSAEVLRDRCRAAGFPLIGESEVAIEWYEQGEHGPIVCRCRIDQLFLDMGVILDIKKIRNAHPRKAARTFVEYGYDLQECCYKRAVAALRPELRGRTDFVFLYMETLAPNLVVPARPDGAFREIGQLRWERALKLWERCLAMGDWPGYANGPVTLEAPAYVISEQIGNY
jgi:hypothetical protein